MKKILALILAVTLTVTSLSVSAQASSDGPGEGKYVSDVYFAYAKTEEEAVQWLVDNGWEPIKGNNDFNAGKTSMFDDDMAVAMGIKRTGNAADAITDMAVMNMKGGYSVPAYEEIVNEKRADIDEFIYNYIPVLEEFRANYNGQGSETGKKRAELAVSVLNKFTDGAEDDIYKSDSDTGLPIGDLLLQQTKQEGNEEGADLEKMILEGSGAAVTAVEQLIALGTDTSKDTWLDRLASLSGDELTENIGKYVPEAAGQDLAPSAVTSLLNEKFQDSAVIMAEQWHDVNDMMIWYEKYNEDHDLWQRDGEDDNAYAARVNSYFEDLKAIDEDRYEEELNMYSEYGLLYESLGDREYAGSWGDTLRDFFNPADGADYSSDPEAFLPMAAALSEGQRSALNIVSLSSLLFMGSSNEAGLDYAKPNVDALFSDDDVSFSVYTGVNRAVFHGGVALTSQALMEQNLGRGQVFDTISNPLGIAAITCYASAAVGVGMMIAGGVMMAKGKTTAFLSMDVERVKNAESTIEKAKDLIQWYKDTYKEGTPAREAGIRMNQTTLKYAEERLKDAKGPESVVPTKMGYAGRVLLVLGGALLIGAAVMEGVSLYQYYQKTFSPIPLMIVDAADIVTYSKDSNGNETEYIEFDSYVYYSAVKCNRQEIGQISDWQDGVDQYSEWGCGDVADLNGDQGQEWLALYTVKSEKKGKPVLADSLTLQYGSSELPKGCSQKLHFFTMTNAVDLGDMAYAYNNDKNGVYFFWDADESAAAGTTASAFSVGHLALAGAGGLVIGLLIATLIFLSKRKKKEAQTA